MIVVRCKAGGASETGCFIENDRTAARMAFPTASFVVRVFLNSTPKVPIDSTEQSANYLDMTEWARLAAEATNSDLIQRTLIGKEPHRVGVQIQLSRVPRADLHVLQRMFPIAGDILQVQYIVSESETKASMEGRNASALTFRDHRRFRRRTPLRLEQQTLIGTSRPVLSLACDSSESTAFEEMHEQRGIHASHVGAETIGSIADLV